MGFRAWVFAAALLLDITAQPLATLRIKVTIDDADGLPRPVPRHALLVSENPSSAAPRRVVTAADGTAEITLKPGNYTIESDEPLVFQGKAYEWAQTIDVTNAKVTSLDLTPENAQIAAAAAPSASSAGLPAAAGNASALFLDWQTSVVSIWSQTMQGSGFLIDARGLIVTNQRLAGRAKTLEVQLSPTEKFQARVLVSDPDKNVAVLWIDAKAAAALRPMKLAGPDAAKAVAEKDKLFAISAPIDDARSLASGLVSRVTAQAILSDVRLDDYDMGTPLFTAAGEVVAITTPEDEDTNRSRSGPARAVRIEQARSVIEAAEKKMAAAEPPRAAPLPVEPKRPIDDEAMREAANRRKGSLAPYTIKAQDFDVSLITPLLVYGARHQGEQIEGRERDRGGRDSTQVQAALRAVEDFGNWTGYVRNDHPVLMIRATPKMVESFWTSLGRAAASTQGVSLPPIKRLKAGFSSMRLSCGTADVTPIHPFKIEQRVGQNEAVYEGLYVFDPAAIGPQCGTVTLTLFSDKAPDKGDVRVIDPRILQQIWQDFAVVSRPSRGEAAPAW